MTLIELLSFLLLSLGFGFAGHLISPRYGWWAGVAMWVPVIFLWLLGLFQLLLNGIRDGLEFWQSRTK